MLLQIFPQKLRIGARLIHFIHKKEYRDLIPVKKLPEGFGMPLNPIRPIDHKNRVIKDRQSFFHLGRKVHMPRSIQQGDLHILQ